MHHTVLHSDAKNDCFGFHVWSRGYNSNFSRYGRIDFHILPSKISLGKPELDFSVGNPELAILRPTDWPSCICARFKVWFALWHSAIVFELQLCNMQDSVFVLYHYYIYYMAVSVEDCALYKFTV